MTGLAPIILFVYNRPWHTEQTLNALMQNELAGQSVLYIYADGPKKNADKNTLQKIADTRAITKAQRWCNEVVIIERDTNHGLAESIINGVTEIVNKHGKIIVLEDDLVTSTGFLKYMNEALYSYEDEEKVMQVSGFMFPVEEIERNSNASFMTFTTSWGWATWKRAWLHFDPLAKGYEALKTDKSLSHRFDLDGSYHYTQMLITQMEKTSLSSWAIRWWWTVFNKNGLVLFPDKSLIKNIGYGAEGTHTKDHNPYTDGSFNEQYSIEKFPSHLVVNVEYFKNVKSYVFLRNNLPVRKSRLQNLLFRLTHCFFI